MQILLLRRKELNAIYFYADIQFGSMHSWNDWHKPKNWWWNIKTRQQCQRF